MGDESISGNAICLIDPNSPSEGDHTWKLTTSTYKKDYILTRINSNNQKDPSGTKLLISPIDQGLDVDGNKITTTENCIIINNFPFDQSFKSVKEDIINNYDEFRNTIPAPFGIRLGYQKDKSKFILNENREEFYPSSQNLFLFNKESIDGLAIAVMAQVDDNNRYSTYRFQTYNKNGLRVNQFEVSDLMNSTVFYPLLTQGKFMVFYPDKQYGSSTGISLFSEAQIFGKNGPTTDKFKAINQNNLPEGNYRSLQSVVNLPNGDFAVINKEIENANTTNSRITGYYGQVFNIDGNPLSNMVEVGKVPELGSNDPYITTPYGGLTFEVKFQGKSAISTSSLGLSSIFIYDKNNMILEPNDSFERLKSRGFLPGGINFEIYPEQCVVQDSSKLPSIKLINLKTADQTTTSLTTIEGDNNIIELASAKAKFDVNGFNGIGGANDNNKNYSKKIMKNTLKTITLSLSFLLITSLVDVKEIRAEEVKKERKFVSQKQQNQKIKYTKEQEQTVLKKIEELNKRDSKLTYNYLTKEEQLIRLEMMKKKYPIKWYLDMMKGFDFENCQVVSHAMDYQCAQDKILYQVSQEKIISVLLHYDDLADEFYRMSEEKDDDFYSSYMLYIDSFVTTLILTEMSSHINQHISGIEALYSRDVLLSYEVQNMIKNKIILNSYRAHHLEQDKNNCLSGPGDLFNN